MPLYTRALALATLVAIAACSERGRNTETEIALPEAIHGLPLIEEHSGEDAVAMIRRLHGEDVAPDETRIGIYGPEDLRTVLYVSRFPTESEARSQLEDMTSRLSEGARGFGHHNQFDVKSKQVHSVFGQGQVHYLFADGEELKWLAVPPRLARPALAEVLGVPVGEIPGLDGTSAVSNPDEAA